MTSTRNRPRALTIIGPGKTGRSIYAAASAAGIETLLVGRRELSEGLAPVHFGPDRITLLAVPDTEITTACRALLTSGRPGGPVGHLSGATGLSALDAAADLGIGVFSMHPLQTFADGATDPTGAHCAVTASGEDVGCQVEALAERLGMVPFSLADEDRGAYHAAAAIASNFLVTLESDAAALLGRLGFEQGREMLAPLIIRSLENWVSQGSSALTGPIARGDEQTVNRHLEALSAHAPELVECYLALAARTRALASPSPHEVEAPA